jgi:amidase
MYRTSARLMVVITLILLVTAAHAQSGRTTFDVMDKSIPELQLAMEAGAITSRQLVQIYLDRIAAYDKQGPALNALVALNPQALEAADALDGERRAGKTRGPLHGIPVLVKDNYETIEMPTTAGSIALRTFHPRNDAFQVRRLKDAGAVIIGKTNMQELASGIVTISSSGGQTKNPYDLGRNPGGSSGGTGAAVAANFAAAGMGSDTCGSIRIPAANNNLVGLRGTQGLSSRDGIVPLSSTQDIGGPLARSVTDLAIMLDATVGADPMDPSTHASEGRIPSPFRVALSANAAKALGGRRIGVLRNYFGTTPEDQEVTTVVNHALETVKQAGAEVIDVGIPGLDDLLANSSLTNAEFKFALADYLARHADAPVKSLGEILDLGLYHVALEEGLRTRNAPERRDSEEYRRAMIKRTALRQAVLAVLDEYRLSAVVYPTLRRKAARIGDPQPGSNCQLSSNSGLPALGMPAGFTDDGVPVGMEMLGRDFSDVELLSMGFAYEAAAKFRRLPFSTPPLVGEKAPALVRIPTAIGEFDYDLPTATLRYRFSPARLTTEHITAIWIHRENGQRPGPALHQLFSSFSPAPNGEVTLSYAARQALIGGQLLLRVYRDNEIQDIKLALPRS